MGRSRRIDQFLALLTATAVLLCCPRPAGAIGGGMGMGMGWGWGFGGMVPSPSQFINDHALVRAGRPQNLPSRTPYANNPNSYINNLRDNGLVSHVDARRRDAPTYRPQRTSSAGNAQLIADALPIASFFNSEYKLTWPSESPIGGDLLEKREVSDRASLLVLNETKLNGVAHISSVTTARERLLVYGRPALKEIRATATQPISDSFHTFLLSLYDSLAKAATAP
jgi:hypothetical protein